MLCQQYERKLRVYPFILHLYLERNMQNSEEEHTFTACSGAVLTYTLCIHPVLTRLNAVRTKTSLRYTFVTELIVLTGKQIFCVVSCVKESPSVDNRPGQRALAV